VQDAERVNGIDFSGQKSLGSCPKCGGSVFEHGPDFVCERSVTTLEDTQASCDFRQGQTILQQPISREQFGKLLDTGKTDFLMGFVSLRTKKSFQARLAWDVAADKIILDFPAQQDPVTPKPAKAAKADTPAKHKPSPAVTKLTSRFFSKHQSVSAEFLEGLFGLGITLADHDKVGTTSTDIGKVLNAVDQSTLNKFLEREDCPNWLGVWVAKHGDKEQQCAYLFRPSIEEEMQISNRIGSRPSEVKRLFWKSKTGVVLEALLAFDDETYLAWARDIGFDGEIKEPNLEPKDDHDYVPTPRGQIDEWIGRVLDPVTDALWKEHVPKEGACTVLQGEMARYIGRLENEYWRNGMINMGDGFFEGMVDKIKETVSSKNSFSPLVKKIVAIDASVVKAANYANLNMSFFQESDVELSLRRLKNVVSAWCLRHLELIPYVPTPLE
jgi:hypothetical protein